MPALCDLTSPERGSSHLRGTLVLLGPATVERDALRRVLLRQLRLTVSVVELPPGPAAAGDAPLAPLDLPPGAELVILYMDNAEGLRAVGEGLRQQAPQAACLGCLLPSGGRPPRPRVDPRTLRQLLGEALDDVVLGMPSPGQLEARMVCALRSARTRREGERQVYYQGATRDLLDMLRRARAAPQALGESSLPQILRHLVRTVGWSRADLVLIEEGTGAVTRCATTALLEELEPPEATEAPRRAPMADAEVTAALRAERLTIVQSARARARLYPERSAQESTVLVVPLPSLGPDGLHEGERLMALLLLSEDPVASIDSGQGEYLQLCAGVMALGLPPLTAEVPRERTMRLTMPRPDLPERRREAVLQYREFFEASADGVLVVDFRGELHYINRAAEQITGYAAAGLLQRSIYDLVPAIGHARLRKSLRDTIDQAHVAPFDMELVSTSGEELVLSVSTSSVLSEQGLAVLAFRDVTQQRSLEVELRRTKDFLERLIDSTVDGIIAADLTGQLILFNQGAARITGWTSDEMVGKRAIRLLYPAGEPQDIMAALRSQDYGGVGRLAPHRRTVLSKDGNPIPVSLTAAIVYESGREVATVGIFTDLRERMDMEQRLQKAQEQAIVAELAGAAAHELNQPLTSVMGYAGLLRRKLETHGDPTEFVDIIVRESERMADIVRKIGRITRYETKPYVGESRIIDLERSTLPEPPPADDVFEALRARKREAL